MKFKNCEGIQYTIYNHKIDPKENAEGLCDDPKSHKPKIIIDPSLLPRRKMNVLIEEIFHAHFFDVSEKKARKFAANLGKILYSKFLKK
jgi:hypothetical protein